MSDQNQQPGLVKAHADYVYGAAEVSQSNQPTSGLTTTR